MNYSIPSLLAGRDTTKLREDLAAAQQAYLDLSSGALGESFSYTQGDGAKSVTYTRSDLPKLASVIRMLQLELGIISIGRRPIRVNF